MKDCKNFEHGAKRDDFDKLADFMDAYNFSCADFLAVVCAHLAGLPQKEFTTELMVAGCEWNITLTKRGGVKR